jgi:hypothetical protein
LKEVKPKPRLKVFLEPEPAPPPKKVHAVVDDVVFDDNLIATIRANLASHEIPLDDKPVQAITRLGGFRSNPRNVYMQAFSPMFRDTV